MISKPINSLFKIKLLEIHQSATIKATDDYLVFEAKLNRLNDLFERFKLLHIEEERLDKLIEVHSHPYYIENYSSEDWLLNQYASRSILLNIDEAEQVSEAIYLGCYSYKIRDKKFELREEIPVYTFNDFLNGKICNYLNTFDHDYNISREDYYKIRNWQVEQLLKIVDYEHRVFIKAIQRYCNTISNPLKFISVEKYKIEAIAKLPINAACLKEKFQEMYIFKDVPFSIFNNELLEKFFTIYKDQKLTLEGIYPTLIKPLLHKVNSRYMKPFGSETTIFFVLDKIADWFELILNGQPVQEDLSTPNWDELFENLIAESKKITKEITAPILEYAYNVDLSKEDVKIYLIDKLEVYRRKFNAFEKKYFFALMGEENKSVLKQMFITNSFFANDLQGQLKAIKESLIIYEVSWEIVATYGEIFDTHKMDYPEKRGACLEVMSLMNQMILDKDLYNELRKCMDDFMEHFHSYRLPIEIHFQNQRETMSDLFRESLSRLGTHLDDAEPTNKILYLQSRLKELRQLELRYKQIKFELEDDHEDDLLYSTLFKEFLEIEADFIKNINEINLLPALPYSNQKPQLLPVATLKRFDEIFPDSKGCFILKLLEDLSITINGNGQLNSKRIGAIRGVVDSLIQNQIAPQLNIRILCSAIAEKIHTPLKSGKIDASKTSNIFFKKANQYISAKYKAVNTV